MAELALKIGNGVQNQEGDIIAAFSEWDIETTWAELLIRGTHNIEGVPFVAELFQKYFKRIRVDNFHTRSSGQLKRYRFRSEVESANESFRVATNNVPQVTRFVDKPKIRLQKPLQDEVRRDIEEYFGKIDLKEPFGVKRLFETAPWGYEDQRKFLLVYIPDREFEGGHQQVRALEENATRGRIDFRHYAGELELDRPLAQLKSSVPGAARTVFAAMDNTPAKANATGIFGSSTLLDVLARNQELNQKKVHEGRIPLPQRFWVKVDRGVIDRCQIIIQ